MLCLEAKHHKVKVNSFDIHNHGFWLLVFVVGSLRHDTLSSCVSFALQANPLGVFDQSVKPPGRDAERTGIEISGVSRKTSVDASSFMLAGRQQQQQQEQDLRLLVMFISELANTCISIWCIQYIGSQRSLEFLIVHSSSSNSNGS